MNFDEAFTLLIGNEKGLSTDRADRGNWTNGVVGKGEFKGSKYGISAMSYPHLDIPNLSLEDAKAIYKKDYWDKLQLNDFPSIIIFDMLDTAVNSGIIVAIKLLQTTVGSKPDGIIGQKTVKAVNSLNPIVLKKNYNANRLLFMTSLSSWSNSGKGWARRIANNLLLE